MQLTRTRLTALRSRTSRRSYGASGACPRGPISVTLTSMLTRSAVAKRIRRSLATVRRLEGTELFPWRDARGVNRFDEAEVHRVAELLRRGEMFAARGGWLKRRRGSGYSTSPASKTPPSHELREIECLRRENEALKRELEQTQAYLSGLVESVEDLF